MNLTSYTEVLLDNMAEIIVRRDPSLVASLYDLEQPFKDEREDVIQYLIREVEMRSNRTHTLREADMALFEFRSFGDELYLVLCVIGTPQGKVMELTDDMMLARVYACDNGLTVDAPRASDTEVQRFREIFSR